MKTPAFFLTTPVRDFATYSAGKLATAFVAVGACACFVVLLAASLVEAAWRTCHNGESADSQTEGEL